MKHPRRTVLAEVGTAALCVLAGCSSLPGLRDESSSPRSWLYDQSEYTDDGVAGIFQYESPAELANLEPHLHPDALADRPWSLFLQDLDRESVEWTMVYGENLLRAPFVRACGGEFDAETARNSIATVFDADDGTELDAAGPFEFVQYDEDRYGLARDGEAACLYTVEREETVRDIVRQRDSSSPGIAATSDELVDLLDTVRLDTSASMDFQVDPDGEVSGNGYGYTADGETTTVRFAVLNPERPLAEMEEYGEIIDALEDVTVEEDGNIHLLEATVDTDRIAFDGTMFDLLRAPYE